jgi:hypothetical protein
MLEARTGLGDLRVKGSKIDLSKEPLRRKRKPQQEGGNATASKTTERG